MQYEELVRDFAKRTISNLDIIIEQQNLGNVNSYEVTQAICALLGLIVFPKENNIQGLTDILLTSGDYADIQQIITSNEVYKPYTGQKNYEFIDLMRNAVSHCNIRIENIGRDVSGIIFWNCPNQPYSEARADWMVYIPANDLIKLCRSMSLAIEKHYLSPTGDD